MSKLCIKNGMVHDAVKEEAYQADILVEDGVIREIAPNLTVDGETEVVDASGLQVYPGFVEAHCHLGLDVYAIGYEGQDYNEYTDILTPHLNAVYGINPLDPSVRMAAKGGVTCVCTGPGSSNVLGGYFVAIKTTGSRVENMIVKEKVAMKCAFGENPKRCYREKNNTSRMSTAAKLREMLYKAKEYQDKLDAAGEDASKKPAYDMKLEALLPVLRGEIPLKAHAHQANDIFTSIRIAKEFGVKLTMEHCTEGHLVVDELAKENYPAAVGPSLTYASKFELQNKTFETPGILSKAGIQVSIITDSPVIPQEYLPLCAGLAVKSGMEPFAALQAITINPAKHIGIADRVGSLEVGKDGDIVLADGDPMVSATTIVATYINGEKID